LILQFYEVLWSTQDMITANSPDQFIDISKFKFL